MQNPDFSVIVPAYQAADIIAACVTALAQQTVPRDRYEVLIVDDGSTDGTAAAARAAGADRVLTIAHQGPAGARNAGVEAARGEIVLFTDADCVPSEDWIAQMSAAFREAEVDGAKGVYRTQQRSLVARFVQLEYEDKYDKMRDLERIDFVDTYSAAYRRQVLVQGGRFDESFPRASGEDIELSYRLAQQGHKLVFASRAVVFHRHPATLKQYLRRKYYVGFWRVRMYRLHPDKMLEDSHTPQSLKIQVACVGSILVFLLLSAVWVRFLMIVDAFAVIFLLSAFSFIYKAMRRDGAVAWFAPGLLLLRALALGLGFASGMVWNVIGRR